MALSADAEDGESVGVMLLGDLRRLFDAEPSGVLSTKEILGALNCDETRPWGERKNGNPLTDRQLAALLNDYEIKPKTVRRGSQTDKGYRQEWFEDAFERYLAPRSVTPSQASNSAGYGRFRSVTKPPDVTDGMREKVSISADCDGVTGRRPQREWGVDL
jgi:hypothetical protein